LLIELFEISHALEVDVLGFGTSSQPTRLHLSNKLSVFRSNSRWQSKNGLRISLFLITVNSNIFASFLGFKLGGLAWISVYRY